MRNSLHLALCAVLVALCRAAEAQPPANAPRIGYVSGAADANSLSPNDKAFQQGLRDLGYIEGKNIVVEYRHAGGEMDRIPSLVVELVQLKVDVLVSPNFNAIRVAKQATTTIPVVMITTVDPVAAGLVDSLARPGGNITGLTRLTRELSGKRLELLKEAVPRVARVGVLRNVNDRGTTIGFKEYEAAARAMKIQLHSVEVRGPNPDLEDAFQAAAKERAGALITIVDAVLTRYRKHIADLAIRHQTPSMCERSDYVEAGCVMSYSANAADSFRRAATYVDKILKGSKPGDLPVERPAKFELVINLKTARQIGLTIPPNVLARADRVIR